MIFIPVTDEDAPLARRLAKTLPRSLSVCIRRFEDTHDPMTNARERVVQAFLAAVDRIQQVGHIWIFSPSLTLSKGAGLASMLAALDWADVAVHCMSDHDEYQPVSTDVVGFAPTGIGFATLAWWAHACLTWEDEPCVESPAAYLLGQACDRTVEMDGDVCAMPCIPLQYAPSMWPEVK